jgi:L-histidine N-alpha-methyltransferase
VPTLAEDVLEGLFNAPRSLPPKYFYDALGSRLFDEICRTDEYYPTRTELGLLARHADDIVATTLPASILELGSGGATKAARLLEACARRELRVRYAPFDVCAEVLAASGAALQARFPWLEVTPLVGDFTAGLDHLELPPGRRLFVFFGGTIGNFTDLAARRFLAELGRLMEEGDHLLLGVDRVKAPQVLHAAYNDGRGVTARFNLNLLTVLNGALAADFDLANFAHRACYNADAERVEMYLDSVIDQRVAFGRLRRTLELRAGESILTEISRKYTADGVEALLGAAGLATVRHFESAAPLFSLVLARKAHG